MTRESHRRIPQGERLWLSSCPAQMTCGALPPNPHKTRNHSPERCPRERDPATDGYAADSAHSKNAGALQSVERLWNIHTSGRELRPAHLFVPVNALHLFVCPNGRQAREEVADRRTPVLWSCL